MALDGDEKTPWRIAEAGARLPPCWLAPPAAR